METSVGTTMAWTAGLRGSVMSKDASGPFDLSPLHFRKDNLTIEQTIPRSACALGGSSWIPSSYHVVGDQLHASLQNLSPAHHPLFSPLQQCWVPHLVSPPLTRPCADPYQSELQYPDRTPWPPPPPNPCPHGAKDGSHNQWGQTVQE